jgi:hypothetical protein
MTDYDEKLSKLAEVLSTFAETVYDCTSRFSTSAEGGTPADGIVDELSPHVCSPRQRMS